MSTDINTIRREVQNLDRTEMAKLAGKLSVHRHELEDFGDVGGNLPADKVEALIHWSELNRLRRTLSDPRYASLSTSLPASKLVTPKQITDLLNGEDNLSMELIGEVSLFMAGGYRFRAFPNLQKDGSDPGGEWIKSVQTVEAVPMGGAHPGPSLGEIAERGALMRELAALPTPALRSLVNSIPKAA